MGNQNLEEIRMVFPEEIRMVFPEEPSKIWDHNPGRVFFDYRVWAFSEDDDKLGHITVSLAQKYPLDKRSDFWFNERKKHNQARPVAVYQGVEKGYFGQEICGRMIILTNEITKMRFEQPLASDTHFIRNWSHNRQALGYAKYPAMRVWEKLEAQGLANSRPYRNKPRWIMK